MSWPAPIDRPAVSSAPGIPATPATPVRPGATASARRRRRGQGFWWAVAGVVLAVAFACCLWFAQPIRTPQFVPLPPGATYVDELGTAYTVLQRLETDHYDDPLEDFEPVPGAVYLEYTVQVDGFRADVINNRNLNMCTFQLVGSSGQIWHPQSIYLPGRDSFCDREVAASSFQVYAIFEVPRHLLDEVLGLVPERIEMNPHWGREPVFSEPR